MTGDITAKAGTHKELWEPYKGCLPISAQRLIVPSTRDPALIPTVVKHPHLRL